MGKGIENRSFVFGYKDPDTKSAQIEIVDPNTLKVTDVLDVDPELLFDHIKDIQENGGRVPFRIIYESGKIKLASLVNKLGRH